ncbi:alpha/beta fold hydrolase [Mastigocoleus testarum]|uniref:Alpha/beta hydrolase n=1 Tax=Mastigocoleus testarum BC008 TaxID=371196 RepID=A0A0V8A0P1_9CYAN|nr:alpha/beta hydrolase [Mastigocoleus testarum]KST70348.1 alpha/beta hydrolase [Mastigocoleus testarum BC008]
MHLNVNIQGKGFPILCLHGHPGSGNSMSVFTEHLSQHFQTIAPDLRGYGKSRTKQDFVMTDHLQDLEELLDRLQIKKCLILGWSLGGIVGIELALKLPHRVTGLILVATAAKPRSNHPPISLQDNLFTGIAALLNYVKPGWDWNIQTFGKKSLFRYLINQHTPSTYSYIAKYAVPAYLQTSSFATRALNRAIKTDRNRIPDLYQIRSPSLMLTGAADRHITALSSLETSQNLSNCKYKCYPQTAHLFPWEIPGQVLGDIDNWLGENLSVVCNQ